MIPKNSMAGAGKPAGPDVWSVSQVNSVVREKLQNDSQLRNLWVEGEIFNVNYHSSGHIYFSIKDAQSNLSATFFRNANARFTHIRLQNGMRILAGGAISVYAPRGSYQLNITRIMLAGEGELRLQIEELKNRLHREGIFDPSLKKIMPFYPVTLGIVTAPTGAAVQDIIRVARTRYPEINILLAPCRVQGDEAPGSICEAIRLLNDPALGVDVIIAGRGGGSFEDLLPFSNETVVRAFAKSRLPIVSAVGHEIDHPLSDMAADKYAATPSAAAEMVVPESGLLRDLIDDCGLRLRIALRNHHRNATERLQRVLQSRVYQEPHSLWQQREQELDLLVRDLRNSLENALISGRTIYAQHTRLLPVYYRRTLDQKRSRFELLAERLQNFSPLGTLDRGYAIVRDKHKNIIRNANQVQIGDALELLLAKGRLSVELKEHLPDL